MDGVGGALTQGLLPRAGVRLVWRGHPAPWGVGFEPVPALRRRPAFGGIAEPPGRSGGAGRGAAHQGVEGQQRPGLDHVNPPDGNEEAGGPAGLLGVQGQVAQQVVRPPRALGANVGGANFTCALKQQRKWSFGVCELVSAANLLNKLHIHPGGGGGVMRRSGLKPRHAHQMFAPDSGIDHMVHAALRLSSRENTAHVCQLWSRILRCGASGLV